MHLRNRHPGMLAMAQLLRGARCSFLRVSMNPGKHGRALDRPGECSAQTRATAPGATTHIAAGGPRRTCGSASRSLMDCNVAVPLHYGGMAVRLHCRVGLNVYRFTWRPRRLHRNMRAVRFLGVHADISTCSCASGILSAGTTVSFWGDLNLLGCHLLTWRCGCGCRRCVAMLKARTAAGLSVSGLGAGPPSLTTNLVIL